MPSPLSGLFFSSVLPPPPPPAASLHVPFSPCPLPGFALPAHPWSVGPPSVAALPNESALVVASCSSRRGRSLALCSVGVGLMNGSCSPITGVLWHSRVESLRPPVQQNTCYPTAPRWSPGCLSSNARSGLRPGWPGVPGRSLAAARPPSPHSLLLATPRKGGPGAQSAFSRDAGRTCRAASSDNDRHGRHRPLRHAPCPPPASHGPPAPPKGHCTAAALRRASTPARTPLEGHQ